jgi:hypothetical protein
MKATVDSNSPVQMFSDAPRFIFCAVCLCVAGVLLMWLFGDDSAKFLIVAVTLGLVAIAMGLFVYWITHVVLLSTYERAQVKRAVHFHEFSPGSVVIGDETTQGYQNFSFPMASPIIDASLVKQEMEQPEETSPPPEYQFKSIDFVNAQIRKDKYENGLTMQQIVDKYEDVTMGTVRKALGKTGR